MTTARATAAYGGAPDALWAVAQDHPRWATFMPGVVSVTVGANEIVEWSIQSPAGPATAKLAVSKVDNRLRYSSLSCSPPFKSLTVELASKGESLELALTIDAEPQFPQAMVDQLAQATLARLCELAGEPAPPGPAGELISIPMSDGVDLSAYLYRTGHEPAGCIVMMGPYRKGGAFSAFLAATFTGFGYHLLIADVRGVGGSVAHYEGLWSERESRDGKELIEWAAEQDFCDGNVATVGGSYLGGNQLLFAAQRPQGLRCIVPMVGMVDTYRDWTHRGGIPSHTNWGAMTYLRSQHKATARRGLEQYYFDFLLDDFDNDAHVERSPEVKLAMIETPTLAIGGWHDYFLRGTVRTYRNVAGPKRLIVGPWGHGDPPPLDEIERWLAYWMRGQGESPAEGKRVRLYVTGAEEWVDLDDWPSALGAINAWAPVSAPTPLRVRTHAEAVEPALNAKPQFIPDPTDSGMCHWGEDHIFDAEPFEKRTVLFGSPGLTVVLRIEGCENADLRARLSVVGTDGSVRQLNEGRLRLSHRALGDDKTLRNRDGDVIVPWHTHTGAQSLEGTVEAHVEIDPICHRFEPGERLRLGLLLVRSDEGAEPATAELDPATRVFLPLA